MNNALRLSLILLWSLWFGGVCALLLFVLRLFAASRDVGVIAAPILFRAFASYSLIVGAICVGVSLVIFTRAPRRADRYALLFLVIALFSAVAADLLTDRIELMRVAGTVQSVDFKRAHAISGFVYLAETAALLCAGIAAIRSHAGAERRAVPDSGLP